MIDITTAIQRAAARVPGPAAARSLAAIPRPAVDWRSIQLAEPDPDLGKLQIAEQETWCLYCFADNAMGGLSQARSQEDRRSHATCPRCGRSRFVRAVDILRPEEYTLR